MTVVISSTDRADPSSGRDHAKVLLERACVSMGAEPDEASSTPPGTMSAASGRFGKLLLRVEPLGGPGDARRRLSTIETLRAQGVPWARPLDLFEPDAGESAASVTVWEWVEQNEGPPSPAAVQHALSVLHQATTPSGLPDRFGKVTEDITNLLGRIRSAVQTDEHAHLQDLLASALPRFRSVEDDALRWPQTAVVHGDALAKNLLHRHDGTVTLIDPDTLAVGHPLVDWQYLARNTRMHEEGIPVPWHLPLTDLTSALDACQESNWNHPQHPLWNAQRLIHLRRLLRRWECDGQPQSDVSRLRHVLSTIRDPAAN